MAVPIFYDAEDVYTNIVAYMKAANPTLKFNPASPEVAWAHLAAYAVGMIWTLTYKSYQNIFASTADLEGLVEKYAEWGLTYAGEDLTAARNTILAKLREAATGTNAWYEATTLTIFGDPSTYDTPVTQCVCIPGYFGSNTIGLYVLSNGGEVTPATIAAIAAYFNTASYKVLCAQVYVRTLSDIQEAAEDASA